MSEIDTIRETLTVLHRRLQEEGYGPEFGQPDPEDLFNAALAALARLRYVEKDLETAHEDLDTLRAENASQREELARSFHLPDEVVDQIRRALGEGNR